VRIVILGLSVTSSWGNGHATLYRGLMRALGARGHDVLFLEHDKPWYAANRDMPQPPGGRTVLYDSVDTLRGRFGRETREAELVVLGSYVPQGTAVADWILRKAEGVTAFYDIDTPVTLKKLGDGTCEYLSPEQVPRFDLYLSFSGGPILSTLEHTWGAQRARPFYCAVDPDAYYPEPAKAKWDLGYLGTYSADRQPGLHRLMLDAARTGHGRFVVAGPGYPDTGEWPLNVDHIAHLAPADHRAFYCAQRFTLNVTRREMTRAGFAPSVRLFEAAGCGVPIISDCWEGLEDFFRPGREIFVAHSVIDTLRYLWETPDAERMAIGMAARSCVLRQHTTMHRAAEIERHVASVLGSRVTT